MAESEQVCTRGPRTQTNRVTMRVVDDRTLTVETNGVVDPGGMKTYTRSTVTYMGPCSAADKAAAARTSAKNCADMAKAMGDSPPSDGSECNGMPAEYKDQCVAQLQAGRKVMDALKSQCK